MTAKRKLYDELSRVLTDYEGNGSADGASAPDLYALLVKIQNQWEDVVTSTTESGGTFEEWLLTGTGVFIHEANGYHNTLVRVSKSADFDYLYIQRQYRAKGIERGSKFEYAGIYCKRDGLVYDVQYALKDSFGEANSWAERSAEALHKNLKAAVRNAVETTVGNDRSNLRITELSSESMVKKMDEFQRYYAGTTARAAYLNGGEDEDRSFEFTFRCEYSPNQWEEDSLLAYILDPQGYVNAEARDYFDSHQEFMLSDFLESDMISAVYTAIIENPSNQIHYVRRIMQAVSASSAKTVTVTICKDGLEFTSKPMQASSSRIAPVTTAIGTSCRQIGRALRLSSEITRIMSREIFCV